MSEGGQRIVALIILIVLFAPTLIAWRWDKIKQFGWRLNHRYISINHRNGKQGREGGR